MSPKFHSHELKIPAGVLVSVNFGQKVAHPLILSTLKLIIGFTFLSLLVKADEGMWMPQLIEAMNFKDMKKNGFKLIQYTYEFEKIN